MALQSRFGTDERFRMDSRFLEEDEDKEEDSGETRISLVLLFIVVFSGAVVKQWAVLWSDDSMYFTLLDVITALTMTLYDSERNKNLLEDDEALEDEKKKNLSILQSILGSSQQTSTSKPAIKAKTFRWVAGAQILDHLEYCIFSRKQVNKINGLFAEMSRRCIMTPAERNTLRLRPKPPKPKKGTNGNY